MDLLLVRHGQSEANRDGIMQGRLDSPLTELGRRQAQAAGRWLKAQGLRWDAAYCSPLRRALDTALQITALSDAVAPGLEPDLAELHVGSIEGRTREEIRASHPDFFERDLLGIGDFSAFGGESYDQVQERVGRFMARLEERHGAPAHTVLLVAHGGLLFQLVKSLVARPVPRIAMLRFGNCTACSISVLERQGVRIGEIVWHVPVQLMGGQPSGGTGKWVR